MKFQLFKGEKYFFLKGHFLFKAEFHYNLSLFSDPLYVFKIELVTFLLICYLYKHVYKLVLHFVLQLFY